jgi:hypothetical protein
MRINRHNSAGRARRLGRAVGVLGLAAGASAGGLLAAAGGVANASPAQYSFSTLNNSNDPTFNQLLGLNAHGVIAGYFGSGAAGHPNKGYYLLPGRTQLDYRIENFPGSNQTQVTGLNDNGTQVGFWAPTNTGTDANYGWYSLNYGRSFHHFSVPNASLGTPPVTQLLGVNDANKAVGFYTDANGNNHGFSYTLNTHVFIFTKIQGATSLTETAISNRGHIAGFFTAANGTVESFLKYDGSHIRTFSVPGATATQAFGVNDSDEVVGSYTVGSGASAVTHGFTWTAQGGVKTVDDPHGIGATTINGVDDHGCLVGFYVDSAGNTDGMLARLK